MGKNLLRADDVKSENWSSDLINTGGSSVNSCKRNRCSFACRDDLSLPLTYTYLKKSIITSRISVASSSGHSEDLEQFFSSFILQHIIVFICRASAHLSSPCHTNSSSIYIHVRHYSPKSYNGNVSENSFSRYHAARANTTLVTTVESETRQSACITPGIFEKISRQNQVSKVEYKICFACRVKENVKNLRKKKPGGIAGRILLQFTILIC